jgi:hypothetical protein
MAVSNDHSRRQLQLDDGAGPSTVWTVDKGRGVAVAVFVRQYIFKFSDFILNYLSFLVLLFCNISVRPI